MRAAPSNAVQQRTVEVFLGLFSMGNITRVKIACQYYPGKIY